MDMKCERIIVASNWMQLSNITALITYNLSPFVFFVRIVENDDLFYINKYIIKYNYTYKVIIFLDQVYNKILNTDTRYVQV